MDDSGSDQEYEEVDLELTNGGAMRNKKWSPSKRPSMPLPDIPGGKAMSNPYTGGVGLRKTISLDSGSNKPGLPPPLPPPNKPSPHQLASSWTKSGPKNNDIRPPAPPPPIKPNSGPPAVPPKPKPGYSPVQTRKSPPRRRRISDDFDIENEDLNPRHFLAKYREALPLHVRVSKGFYGSSDRTSVSEGDTFNIHFIKNTKVICMEDGGGAEYKIALNSGIEFGIMYSPDEKRDEAVAGYSFEKVSDLLQAKTLPKVVRTGVAWSGGGKESTIQKHELLILKGWKRKISSKLLKAYNPVTKLKKELPENCVGKFSTRTYDTRLYLSDMIDHVMHPLPCKAVLYMNADNSGDIDHLNTLSSAVLSLKALTTETTLVATNAFVEGFDETQAVEIPVDLDIDLQVMRPKEEKETEDLYSTTRKLLENFTRLRTSQFVTNSGPNEATQSALYSIIREGREWAGVDVVKPAAIYMNTTTIGSSKSAKSPSKLSSVSRSGSNASSPKRSSSGVPRPSSAALSPNSESSYEEYDEMVDQFDATRLNHIENEISVLGQKLESLAGIDDTSVLKISREIISARADMKRMEMRVVKAAEDAAKAKSEVSEMRPMLEQLRELCEGMKREMRVLRDNAGQANSVLPNQPQLGYMTLSPSGISGEKALMDSNRKYIGGLTCNQVLNLLDSMGLPQHRDAFMAERVNGEILLECDDTVLQEELKITSKLQRVRLLKVINGKHSAEMILCGEDPYAYVQPK